MTARSKFVFQTASPVREQSVQMCCTVLTDVCREDIEEWEAAGVLTKACVSFSRDSSLIGSPRYVQDNIDLHGSHLAHLIHSCNATVSSPMTVSLCVFSKRLTVLLVGIFGLTCSHTSVPLCTSFVTVISVMTKTSLTVYL